VFDKIRQQTFKLIPSPFDGARQAIEEREKQEKEERIKEDVAVRVAVEVKIRQLALAAASPTCY